MINGSAQTPSEGGGHFSVPACVRYPGGWPDFSVFQEKQEILIFFFHKISLLLNVA